ncbi:MAG: hypothetical protein GXY45_05535 [Ramlibacter sp.]|nr:hypothetical protein [Ramlibacter sp.]
MEKSLKSKIVKTAGTSHTNLHRATLKTQYDGFVTFWIFPTPVTGTSSAPRLADYDVRTHIFHKSNKN